MEKQCICEDKTCEGNHALWMNLEGCSLHKGKKTMQKTTSTSEEVPFL